MNSMASAVPVANSVFVVTPHSGYPVAPGVSQVPSYPNNQPQFRLVAGNPGLVSNVNVQPVQKVLKEGKTLGAIQIIIGLVHISLGSTLATLLLGQYVSISFYGGYPFWGGIWFIISGSLSVAAENQPSSYCLLSGSLGLNIVSAISSAVGVLLLIADLSIPHPDDNPNYYPYAWGVNPGIAISSVLLIFSFLELAIACTSSHFGCQLLCCQPSNVGQVSVIYPNVNAANPVVTPEPAMSPPPPSYSSALQANK
ncbi:membrane-spanning 4-domains subfamily A member 8-like isoform X1 [Sapajus apella]|uniref:Membrane-spanning 4-domains subfamily A member 8-like isoform X1 n=1 Tax=Sapajus apella TaxID=9515 RepID=A0A6J3I9F9_SAPAP|nr:membrane-spanning 4-domains subfamily A member 8-like isoform X1 [Sapajus apella]